MATFTWDTVLKEVQLKGVDCVIVYGGTSKGSGRVLERRNNHEEVLAALNQLRDSSTGSVLVVGWKGGAKDASYEWTVAGAGGPLGFVGSTAGADYLSRYVESKLELETLKLQHQYETRPDELGKLGNVLLQYLPVVAHAVGFKLPKVNGAAVGADAAEDGDDDDDGDAGVGGIPDDEMEAMLADVVEYARRNPDQARQFRDMLRNMKSSGNG